MEIKVYSTSTCSTCHVVTNWLEKQGLDYIKIITDEDEVGMQEFMSVNDGHISVPLTVIKKDTQPVIKMSGFNAGQFKSALGL